MPSEEGQFMKSTCFGAQDFATGNNGYLGGLRGASQVADNIMTGYSQPSDRREEAEEVGNDLAETSTLSVTLVALASVRVWVCRNWSQYTGEI